MPVASKVVPSVIAASVCWSLQCLVSTLTQRGQWKKLFFFFFLGSLVQSRCGEGGGCCKQVTLACTRSASATLGLPPHCSGSRLFRWEPSEASPGLHVPPRSKPLRFRHLGSLQRRRLGWACILCPSQVQAAQVMRCLANAVAVTYRLPAARLSGCTTGALSQVDVDRPEPQEVLVSKEACLQFCR